MDDNKSVAMAAILAVVLVVGVVGFFVLTNNDDSTNESTEPAASQQVERQTNNNTQQQQAAPQPNVVEAAVATADLSTLATAVTEAGLIETLSGEGPFTVFAPTNDAFAALPEGTLDSLLAEESKESLTGILTYHVVAGEVFSSDLSDGQVIETVQGGTLTVKFMDGKVMLEDENGGMAEVVTPDVDVSNGVVHIIDAVVLPS